MYVCMYVSCIVLIEAIRPIKKQAKKHKQIDGQTDRQTKTNYIYKLLQANQKTHKKPKKKLTTKK